ncbi:hypothetical protein [Nocardia rhizosphaerae]|uniref:Ig-like domain-containing protein n=1 Tax=Nocardia rhizosphaerae TaxID=1691571 RepID=A0ABV8KY55_9NOCA
MTTLFRRDSWPALIGSALAAVVATAAFAAPAAHASGTQYVEVAGSDHRAGCAYTVTAVGVVGYSSADSGAEVTFYDNGVPIDSVWVPTVGATTATWRPAAAGTHELTAKVVLLGTKWITPTTVTVAPATGTGSAACGLPSFSG